MIENRAQLMEALNYIGSKIENPVNAYLIGGAAMMWHNLKYDRVLRYIITKSKARDPYPTLPNVRVFSYNFIRDQRVH
jgi:hypothetical protein